MKKLSSKLMLIVFLVFALVIAFLFGLAHYLYEQLYVENVEQSMIEVGNKLHTHYRGGAVTDDLIEQVEAFNDYSYFDVFAVRDAKELSACVPFEVDYDALINAEVRSNLLNGEAVTKIGYEPRFDRQVISVIVPFIDQNRLEGILYMYYPLAKIIELTNEQVLMIAIAAALFLVLILILLYKAVQKVLNPLQALLLATKEMKQKQYHTRVSYLKDDEVGELGRAFNEMAESIEKEEEAQRAFLATISHELRTPLSYVKGYSEAIQHDYIEPDKLPETISLIAREANRMQRMTNDLLMLTRKEPIAPIQWQPIVLEECVRESLAILEQQINEKQMEVKLHCEGECIAKGDEEKVKQIFINILENAITFSEVGGKLDVTVMEASDVVRVVVKDYGVGIPAEDLPHITKRFYRVNKARSRSNGGSGLGLSIVQQIVRQLNGQIEFESELGVGTIVKIDIPKWEDL